MQQRQPPLSSFNMQRPFSSFNTTSLRNQMNQAAFKARQAASSAKQFVSGAAGSVTGAVNSFINPNAAAVKPNRFASSGSKGSGSGSGIVGDGGYPIYTRAQLNELYGNNSGKRTSSFMNTNFLSLGEGPVDHMIMMFQLYIALIAALSRLSMNAASMSASLLFGNEALINLFSVFLENALNIILNRKVADMSFDELHQSLKDNQPKLEQMSALLINAMSTLAVGLSDICSKIATEWVAKVLPGLLQSSAKGVASAAKAGLAVATVGASDEVLDIISTSASTVGLIVKTIQGLASSAGDFSKALTTVQDAYKKLMELKDLFSKSPSEIAEAMRDAAVSATAAAIPQSAKDFANTFTSKAFDLKRNPFVKVSLGFGQNGEPSSSAPSSASSASPSSPPSSELTPPSESSIHNLASKIKENFGTVKDIASKFGITVTGLSDLAEKIRTNSKLALFLAQRFGMTVTGIQGSMLTRLADAIKHEIKNSGDPESATVRRLNFVEKNIRPVAVGLGKVSDRLDKASKFIYKDGGGGGSKSRDKNKNKMKSRKYLKNKKHFKRYMSNLRRKTAKKELDLLNGIRDFKSMIHL
jgi:hypothetical protein